MVIYQIAHEYQIPTVLKKAETVLTEHIASQKYAAKDCISASEYNQTFLHKAFKMLNFAQGYGINALMAASAERLSAFPMETFTKHPSYMGLPESIKNRILMYRLKRFDRCAVQDKLVKLD